MFLRFKNLAQVYCVALNSLQFHSILENSFVYEFDVTKVQKVTRNQFCSGDVGSLDY